MRRTPSLRTRFVLIVLLGAVLPLALIGLWLNRSAERSGERLLRSRLEESLETTAQSLRRGWVRRRSELLTVAEDPSAQAHLVAKSDSSTAPGSDPSPPGSLVAAVNRLGEGAVHVSIRDLAGDPLWDLTPADVEPGIAVGGRTALAVRLPIYERATGRVLGALHADVPLEALLDEQPAAAFPAGVVLAAFDPTTGASLFPLPFDPEILAAERFSWGGDEWLAARVALEEPAVRLVAVAPLTPVTRPFQEAARRGVWWLLIVAIAAFALTATLTGRIAGSLARLTAAAEDVSRGNLERRVEERRTDEVGRLGRAFNTMTDSLRSTLRELADRQALAAVGEFAASLSHEIRNALTSIRLDLQLLEEEPAGPRAREIRERALAKATHLSDTVAGTLAVARSGKIGDQTVELHRVLRAAAQAAAPEFDRRGATLRLQEPEGAPGDVPRTIRVRGDAGALEQLFLNLLLNAAQAVEEGGSARVRLRTHGELAVITIEDTGAGIPPELRDRIFEPFFSTRAEGTGLGLAIARRIARVHGGRLRLAESTRPGAAFEVLLPLASEDES